MHHTPIQAIITHRPTAQENTDKQTQCKSQKVIHAILTHKPTVQENTDKQTIIQITKSNSCNINT